LLKSRFLVMRKQTHYVLMISESTWRAPILAARLFLLLRAKRRKLLATPPPRRPEPRPAPSPGLSRRGLPAAAGGYLPRHAAPHRARSPLAFRADAVEGAKHGIIRWVAMSLSP
jgi:hypothetical protein